MANVNIGYDDDGDDDDDDNENDDNNGCGNTTGEKLCDPRAVSDSGRNLTAKVIRPSRSLV